MKHKSLRNENSSMALRFTYREGSDGKRKKLSSGFASVLLLQFTTEQ